MPMPHTPYTPPRTKDQLSWEIERSKNRIADLRVQMRGLEIRVGEEEDSLKKLEAERAGAIT